MACLQNVNAASKLDLLGEGLSEPLSYGIHHVRLGESDTVVPFKTSLVVSLLMAVRGLAFSCSASLVTVSDLFLSDLLCYYFFVLFCAFATVQYHTGLNSAALLPA